MNIGKNISLCVCMCPSCNEIVNSVMVGRFCPFIGHEGP